MPVLFGVRSISQLVPCHPKIKQSPTLLCGLRGGREKREISGGTTDSLGLSAQTQLPHVRDPGLGFLPPNGEKLTASFIQKPALQTLLSLDIVLCLSLFFFFVNFVEFI